MVKFTVYLLFLSGIITMLSCSRQKVEFDVWPHSYLVPLEREKSMADGSTDVLNLRTTPGEYEPAVFAVRTDTTTSITLSMKGTGNQPLPEDWCKIQVVKARTDSTPLNRLFDFSGPVKLRPQVPKYFWVTVKPPSEASAGNYTSNINLQAGGTSKDLEINCEVLPFTLKETEISGGAFMAQTDLRAHWFKDMKKHGIDAFQFFTWEWASRSQDVLQAKGEWWDPVPIKIRNKDGELFLDFTTMDTIMNRMGRANMEGPVVVSLGNDHHLFYECRLADEFDIRVDTNMVNGRPITGPPVSKRLDSLFVEGMEQLRNHWDKKGFEQELVILIYDEPTERLLKRSKDRYDLLKKHLPETRIYGVVMNREDWARSMLDQMDITVANGDFKAIKQLTEKYNKDFWVYGGVRGIRNARYLMGLMPWQNEAQGSFFWMYNYWFYNPDNCAVYQHPENPRKLVQSTWWEAIREGRDDLHYLTTAEKLIDEASGTKKKNAQERFNNIKNLIKYGRQGEPPKEIRGNIQKLLEFYNEPRKVRNEIIDIIIDLKNNNKGN